MTSRDKIPRSNSQQALETAAQWWVERDHRPASEDEQREFEHWVGSADHAEAHARIERVWDAFAVPDSHATLARLRETALAETCVRRSVRGRMSWVLGGSLVATICACALLLLWIGKDGPVILTESMASYHTGVGEQLVVHLRDGSKVTLDTASEIHVAMSSTQRRVELRQGRALFEVVGDTGRPFVVDAAGYRTRALGTVFEVRLGAQALEVILVEGRVQLESTPVTDARGRALLAAPVMLQPGQRFNVTTEMPQPTVAAINVETELLWRDGFVEFDNERLDRAVAELNRYAARPVRIEDPAVAELRVSGIFRTQHIDRFVDIVTTALPVEARQGEGQSVELVLKQR